VFLMNFLEITLWARMIPPSLLPRRWPSATTFYICFEIFLCLDDGLAQLSCCIFAGGMEQDVGSDEL
jgi:hypothetical protein